MKKQVCRLFAFLLLLSASVFAGWLFYLFQDQRSLLKTQDYRDDDPLTAALAPQPCTAAAPLTHKLTFCPPGHAFFGNDDPMQKLHEEGGNSVPVIGRCCPLPAEDILSDEHLFDVTDTCPDSYIATGGTASLCGTHCVMRCTRINSSKYRLGPPQPAFYWKQDGLFASNGRGLAKQIRWSSLPAAIRDGIAMPSRSGARDVDGCVGVPFGSVLSAKKSNTCSGYMYRQLFFRERDIPVRMFPGDPGS